MTPDQQKIMHIPTSVPEDDPYINPDRLAAHKANESWESGKWLQWATDGGQEPTREAREILGGRHDVRALGDVGLDGTILAQDKKVIDDKGTLWDRLDRFGIGEPTPSDKLMNDLRTRDEFYTSPVVRESERLLSSTPIEVEQDLANIVMVWTGGDFYTPAGDKIEQDDDWNDSDMSFMVPEGKRLIIDNLPKGSKYDDLYTDENPLQRMQVHIYHNAHGYLVADKVFANAFGPEVYKKREISLKSSQSGNNLEIDQDVPEKPAMESLWPSNDRKQEYKNPVNPKEKTVHLLSTTSEFSLPEHSYNNFETTIRTADDAGDTVDINIEFINGAPPKEIGPVIFRLVDNTGTDVAHHMYQ
jgi:hypothetical protein